MTRRRNNGYRSRKRSKYGTQKKIIIAIAIVIVLAVAGVALGSWIDSRNSAAPTPTAQTSDRRIDTTLKSDDELRRDAERLGLLEVKMPDGVPSQIIHYPGFIMSFNPERHIPNWVAWELTADEVDLNVVGKRGNKFAPDENVPGSAVLDDYRNSGFDRGHMAPAADMKWSEEAQSACFLLTNMCPQVNDLNAGAWRVLEEKCRSVAKRDGAVVIVCGPVLTDRLKRKIGPTGVTVPERFFKVVLSPFSDKVRGMGFVMPNSSVQGGLSTTAMSIDQVEQITGYDFFSALDDDVENEVEAQSDFLRWSRK